MLKVVHDETDANATTAQAQPMSLGALVLKQLCAAGDLARWLPHIARAPITHDRAIEVEAR